MVFLSSRVFLTLRASLILKVYQKMSLTSTELQMGCLTLMVYPSLTECLSLMEFEITMTPMKHFQCRLK